MERPTCAMHSSFVPQLPNELWIMILSYLPLRTLYHFLYVFPDKASLAKDSHWKQTDIEGNTFMHFAALTGDMATVKKILALDKKQADRANYLRRTPLSLAAEAGHQSVVELLISQPNVEINSGRWPYTPLMHAVSKGHEGIARCLLQHDETLVDLSDSRDSMLGQSLPSPLVTAARVGNETIFRLLVEKCPELATARGPKRETPLLHACWCGHEPIVRYLLAREDIVADIADFAGYTPLMQAAKMGYDSIVKLLLDRDDVNPNARDKHGWTPLIGAVRTPATAKLLLARDDVDVNIQATDGRSALTNAIKSGKDGEEVFKMLLDHPKLDAWMKDSSYKTPLHHATVRGDSMMAKILLEQRDDIDINCKDSSGRSALSYAAQWGNIDAVRLLLARDGIDADAKCFLGFRPLAYAIRYDRNDVVDFMKAKGYSLKTT